MSWIIGTIITYLVIGTLLAWMLSAAGGEKFKLNKKSLPFIISWPKLVFFDVYNGK